MYGRFSENTVILQLPEVISVVHQYIRKEFIGIICLSLHPRIPPRFEFRRKTMTNLRGIPSAL